MEMRKKKVVWRCVVVGNGGGDGGENGGGIGGGDGGRDGGWPAKGRHGRLAWAAGRCLLLEKKEEKKMKEREGVGVFI